MNLIPQMPSNNLVVKSIHEFLEVVFPPQEEIMSWMKTQSLNMIYAWRGTGKTHVALGIACAVASGGDYLNWKAEKPRKVFYIDGEMPGCSLQERLAAILKNQDQEIQDGYLRILTPDLQSRPIPDLATFEGQQLINAHVLDAELIIVDNLSCLVRGDGKENTSESWLNAQGWALSMRAKGKSVLFLHHSGKDGRQRGTSKREDLLDTVIRLSRPATYNASDGAVFEVHFEKARHLFGEEVLPFEARLSNDSDCGLRWSIIPLVSGNEGKILQLVKEGVPDNQIQLQLGIDRSTVYRNKKALEKKGLYYNGEAKNEDKELKF